MFRIAINKLFEWLVSEVLVSHHGGSSSIPSRDMSVSRPLVLDEDDLFITSLFVGKTGRKDLLCICLLAIYVLYCRAEREYVIDEDFMKAVRKVAENKKLETKLDYKPI
jgi:hypothetical protein